MSIAMPLTETPTAKKPRRMPPSPKRIEANRRNARRSTGPRTAEGKKRSSQNARYDHSKMCSVDASVTTENDATFYCHIQDMHDIFKPHTVLQHQLFPQLCALQWTLNRMIEAEVKIYQSLARYPDEPPCEIIARVFVENPTRNPLVAFDRYWRQRQAEYWRLVREYDRISQRQDTVDPDEAQQWEETRRLQEQRDRNHHRQAMARRVAEVRAETGGADPVEHGLETHATTDAPVTNEPTSGGENGDIGSESGICAVGEEKMNPLAGKKNHEPVAKNQESFKEDPRSREVPKINYQVPRKFQKGKHTSSKDAVRRASGSVFFEAFPFEI